MRYGRTAIRGKRKRRMKFRACGPSLSTHFDLMAVALKAPHPVLLCFGTEKNGPLRKRADL